jgi:hypothetical protein
MAAEVKPAAVAPPAQSAWETAARSDLSSGPAWGIQLLVARAKSAMKA